MKSNRTVQPMNVSIPIRRRLAIFVVCLLVPPLLAGGLLLAPPPATTAQTPSPATSWRDTFDTWDNLYSQSNVDVVSGSLTLAPDNKWIQTTQADFEAGNQHLTQLGVDSSSVSLLDFPHFSPAAAILDDTGFPYAAFSSAMTIDPHGNIYLMWESAVPSRGGL